MQAFYALLRYEWDPALRAKYMIGWNRLYSHLREQEDAFWDIANAVFVGEIKNDFSLARRWYRRYPTDLVRWQIDNGGRKDTTPAPAYYTVKASNPNLKRRSDGRIFPPDERPNARHNTTQFEFSGGPGSLYEMDGGDALWPYWLGRYYGFIAAPAAH
jgi:hypothetical protein